MAHLTIVDINTKARILRGDIGTISGVTTALTWYDLGNPQGVFPFDRHLGGNDLLSMSVEGIFSLTFQIYGSLVDTPTGPPTTPCGAAPVPWFTLATQVGTAPFNANITRPVRWIALNCSAWVSGSATGWLYGVLPS